MALVLIFRTPLTPKGHGKDWRSTQKVFSFKTTRVFSDLLFCAESNGATPVALRGRQRVQNGRQSWKKAPKGPLKRHIG